MDAGKSMPLRLMNAQAERARDSQHDDISPEKHESRRIVCAISGLVSSNL
jgi:hypothetical protein